MNNKEGDNSGEINAGLNGDGKWVHLIRPTPNLGRENYVGVDSTQAPTAPLLSRYKQSSLVDSLLLHGLAFLGLPSSSWSRLGVINWLALTGA